MLFISLDGKGVTVSSRPLYSQLLVNARKELNMTSDEAADELHVGPCTCRNADYGRGGKLLVSSLEDSSKVK